MPSIYQPRRPRASPLWQIVHHGWDAFFALYEKFHRKTLGPLDHDAVATVQSFLRCGDLASGFTRLECPDYGHERLLAFTCIRRRQRLWRTGRPPLLPRLPPFFATVPEASNGRPARGLRKR